MAYGEIIITLSNLKIAAWNASTGEYGTPYALSEGQTLSVVPMADNDTLKSYGSISRLLTTVTYVAVTIGDGALEAAAVDIMIGSTTAASGASGDQTKRIVYETGRNLPYFGVIGEFQADDGGNTVVGVPLVKLDSAPSLEVTGQNTFLIRQTAGKGVKNSASAQPRVCVFIDQNQQAKTISDFDAFFEIA